MRNSYSKGILRLKHLREHNEATAEEMEGHRERFERLKSDKSKPVAVSSFQLFQTPDSIADMMSKQLGDVDGLRILEPSAGLGQLYRAVRKQSETAHITLIEIAIQLCEQLYKTTDNDRSCQLLQRDFLTVMPEEIGLFDCVFMNPPFYRGTDIKHIRHAEKFLKPGGKLISLCYAGQKQRTNLTDYRFELLPSRSFATSGTSADVAMITNF